MDPKTNSLPALPETTLVDQMDACFYQVAIFRAALELEVWGKVAAGLSTAEEIASTQRWDFLGTRLLLDDLCVYKLLERQGDRYYLTPEAETYLVPDRPTYMGRALLADYGWQGHDQLAETIRTGKRPVGYSATKDAATDFWIGVYARSWAAPETSLARWDAMWQKLGIEARDGLRVLDVACGPAPKSLALARAHPGVCVTLLDWGQILAVAGKVAADLGVSRQVTPLEGDLWTAPFGSNQFDVVYLGNITHFFSPEQNTRLFQRTRDALVERGMLVVNAVRRESPDPMAPGLWLYAVSEGGAPYSFQEYRDMLERAGYTDVVDVDGQPIRATKHY